MLVENSYIGEEKNLWCIKKILGSLLHGKNGALSLNKQESPVYTRHAGKGA
jgi:hypothetical protein